MKRIIDLLSLFLRVNYHSINKEEFIVGNLEQTKEENWKRLKNCVKDFEKARGCECLFGINDPNCPYKTNEELEDNVYHFMRVSDECGYWAMHVMNYCYVRNGRELCFK